MSRRKLYEWGPVPLRLALGIGFVVHGYPKLFTADGHQQFLGTLTSLGVPLPGLGSWVLGGLEFFGGLALIAGLLVLPISLLLIVQMLVALFAVHLPHGFSFIQITGMTESGPQFGMPGYEVNLLYIAGLASLALTGAGALSAGQPAAVREETSPEAVRRAA